MSRRRVSLQKTATERVGEIPPDIHRGGVAMTTKNEAPKGKKTSTLEKRPDRTKEESAPDLSGSRIHGLQPHQDDYIGEAVKTS